MVVGGTRDGGIAIVAEVVDGSRSFCILILIGKKCCNHASQNSSVLINKCWSK